MSRLIYPVIHHVDLSISMKQVALAQLCGADGIFLISHQGQDEEVVRVAIQAKRDFKDFKIGINLLSTPPLLAAEMALDEGLDAVWADTMGVASAGLSQLGKSMSELAKKHANLLFFASVAFKYQPLESDPSLAAKWARLAGFIPTTSGEATGSAPSVEKIKMMSCQGREALGIASGMTPENIMDYAPFLSHVLVATGISIDVKNDCIDPKKLKSLIQQMRPSAAQTLRK